MARVKRSSDLGSIEARRKLKVRSEPYFMVVERGLALGYRKTVDGGAWVARRYDSATRRNTESRIATADDAREADGNEVLNFGQAQRKLMTDAKLRAEQGNGKHYTVAEAIGDYVDYLRAHRKSASDTELKLKAYVVPFLGDKRLSSLSPSNFDEWLKWALKRQQRRKSKKIATVGKKQSRKQNSSVNLAVTPVLDAEEQRRRRKSTVNRVIASLKACLNYAHECNKVASSEAWSRLKKFRAVESARLRWLTEAEAKRLINASAPDLRSLVQAGLMTGCREGELIRATMRDFDAVSETLLVPDSKSGKPRRIPLTEEGVSLFESLTAGRPSGDLIFTRSGGFPWHRVAVIRAMQDASNAGKISPPATFYTLRHTYASHLVQEGMPLLFVASALGHRDARMVEKHYGHFAPSHVAAMIRKKLPAFGIETNRKVRVLRQKSQRVT